MIFFIHEPTRLWSVCQTHLACPVVYLNYSYRASTLEESSMGEIISLLKHFKFNKLSLTVR